MAQQFPEIQPAHEAFIQKQRIFFNASAAATGRVNLSPRGTGAFRVLTPTSAAYLDFTGSGNETAAHLKANGRLTLMFCSFDGPPMILRLYGHGRVLRRASPEYGAILASAFNGVEPPGTRQMVLLDIDLVQTSCGFGVPQFGYVADRTTLTQWAANKGPAAVEAYQREKNIASIDGFPTGLFERD